MDFCQKNIGLLQVGGFHDSLHVLKLYIPSINSIYFTWSVSMDLALERKCDSVWAYYVLSTWMFPNIFSSSVHHTTSRMLPETAFGAPTYLTWGLKECLLPHQAAIHWKHLQSFLKVLKWGEWCLEKDCLHCGTSPPQRYSPGTSAVIFSMPSKHLLVLLGLLPFLFCCLALSF